jgi:ATP-dependent Clp protease ATP-binding subunit ClpX
VRIAKSNVHWIGPFGSGEDFVLILTAATDPLVAQYRKLIRFCGADLAVSDDAVKEIAKIALERGKGARGLRSVIEDVLEGVLCEVRTSVRYVITKKTVKVGRWSDGELVKLLHR